MKGKKHNRRKRSGSYRKAVARYYRKMIAENGFEKIGINAIVPIRCFKDIDIRYFGSVEGL